jgi:hypothetical protein
LPERETVSGPTFQDPVPPLAAGSNAPGRLHPLTTPEDRTRVGLKSGLIEISAVRGFPWVLWVVPLTPPVLAPKPIPVTRAGSPTAPSSWKAK